MISAHVPKGGPRISRGRRSAKSRPLSKPIPRFTFGGGCCRTIRIYVPPGYSAPDNLSPGHPGEHYSEKLPDPVIYPVSSDSGSTSD
ncbi:hypothetical protein CA85_42700 [Allorhodopirellula solitaria]|uniref:Uncharacterized protein n=1 Tax=Allorhodopirellula solitaria TaxID=2527987 RepID=A0A5C5X0E0_9BACT|nr:hypothetical protein CA85_42700 [Allorhodopirellula solitaria]